MTWAQLASTFPQGRNGVWSARFDGGKIVSRFPWWAQLLCAALLDGYAGGRGVIFAKGAINIFRWSKSWLCVCLCPCESRVDIASMRTHGGGIHWVGPMAPRTGLADTVAAVASEHGAT